MTTPDQIANLGFWHKGDAITGAADGTPLPSWLDSSGNANTLSQATQANQPTYHISQINGLPAVQSDGVDDCMTAASSATNNTEAWTVFVVLNGNSGQNGHIVAEKWDGSAGTYPFSVRLGSSYNCQYRAYGGGKNPVCDDGDSAAGWAIHAGDRGGGNLHAYVNGTLEATTADTTTGATVNTVPMSLFSRGTQVPAAISLAEIIYYTRVLTATERAQVDSYLQDKYAITVSDYVASGGGSASLSDSIPLATSLARTAASAVRSLADSLGLSTLLARASRATRALADTLGLSTSLGRSQHQTRSTTDTLAVSTSPARTQTQSRGTSNSLAISTSLSAVMHPGTANVPGTITIAIAATGSAGITVQPTGSITISIAA